MPLEEVQALLAALYDTYPSKLTVNPSKFPFSVLPLLNMAHEFPFDSILLGIITQVTAHWPKSLVEFDTFSLKIPFANSVTLRDVDPTALVHVFFSLSRHLRSYLSSPSKGHLLSLLESTAPPPWILHLRSFK